MTAVTLMVTLSRVITSCGGTVSVTMRKSILSMREMKGGTRKRPGPFAPIKRPSTKITPRSYGCTTRIAESGSQISSTTLRPRSITTKRFMSRASLKLSKHQVHEEREKQYRHHPASVLERSQMLLPAHAHQEETFCLGVSVRLTLEGKHRACLAPDHSRSTPFDRCAVDGDAVLAVARCPAARVGRWARLDRRYDAA